MIPKTLLSLVDHLRFSFDRKPEPIHIIGGHLAIALLASIFFSVELGMFALANTLVVWFNEAILFPFMFKGTPHDEGFLERLLNASARRLRERLDDEDESPPSDAPLA